MTDQPGVFVESERTKTVGRLDVAPQREFRSGDPEITLNPMTSTVTVGGGAYENAGEVQLTDIGSVSRGVLSARDGHGRLELRNTRDEPNLTVTADDDSPEHSIRVFSGGNETTRLEHTTDGPRLAVMDVQGAENKPLDEVFSPEYIVEGRVDSPSQYQSEAGRAAVKNRLGYPTCRLLGRDGALVLTDRHEGTDQTEAEATYGNDAFGGGELVVRTNDTVDDSYSDASDTDDIHVHAKGERDSDYGVDADNRPRIHLDGPEATVELGRRKIDEDRPGVNGEIHVRGESGEVLLEAGTTENRLTNENGGELVFRRSSSGTVEPMGSIAAHRDGLMIRFAQDTANDQFPAALLVTKRGQIKLSGELQTDGV